MRTKYFILILCMFFIAANICFGWPLPPIANVVDSPDPVYVANSVTLDGSSSYDPDGGNIIQYQWDFTNNGSYDYTETPSLYPDGEFDGKTTHVYVNVGNKTAKIRVKDDESTYDTDTCTVHVVGIKNITTGTAYSTIQAALTAASNGDVIEVQPGTYKELIDFGGVACTLRSIDPNDWDIVQATIIDGSDSGDTVTFNSGEDANSILKGFTITGGHWVGVSCSSTSPSVSNCIVEENNTGLYIYYSSSPIITNNIIRENASAGIWLYTKTDYMTTPVISNNKIYNNNGDGISGMQSSGEPGYLCPTIKNNWIYGNTNGMKFWRMTGVVTNNTVANNTTSGIENTLSSMSASNCIIWDNSAHDSNNLIGSFSSVTYSCIKGGYEGEGNIDSDPRFFDPNNDNYHLVWNSPCVDTGDPNGNYNGQTDIDGNPRVVDGDGDNIEVVDMGADEHTLLKARLGIITDVHYTDANSTDRRKKWPHSGPRFYSEALDDIREFVMHMNDVSVLDASIELGDLIDIHSENSPEEGNTNTHDGGDYGQTILQEVEAEFAELNMPYYHVIGNWDLYDYDFNTPADWFQHIINGTTETIQNLGGETFTNANDEPNSVSRYYSFNFGDFLGIVLDSSGVAADSNEFFLHSKGDNGSGWITPDEQNWLEEVLAENVANEKKPVVIFIHPWLWPEVGSPSISYYNCRNAGEVRDVLEEDDNVVAVFQGHHHPGALAWWQDTVAEPNDNIRRLATGEFGVEENGIKYFCLRGSIIGWGITVNEPKQEPSNAYYIATMKGQNIEVESFGSNPDPQVSVTGVRIYTSDDYSDNDSNGLRDCQVHFGHKDGTGEYAYPDLYIEIDGTNGDSNSVDLITLCVRSESDSKGIDVDFLETGPSTNKYRTTNPIHLATQSNQDALELKVMDEEILFVDGFSGPKVDRGEIATIMVYFNASDYVTRGADALHHLLDKDDVCDPNYSWWNTGKQRNISEGFADFVKNVGSEDYYPRPADFIYEVSHGGGGNIGSGEDGSGLQLFKPGGGTTPTIEPNDWEKDIEWAIFYSCSVLGSVIEPNAFTRYWDDALVREPEENNCHGILSGSRGLKRVAPYHMARFVEAIKGDSRTILDAWMETALEIEPNDTYEDFPGFPASRQWPAAALFHLDNVSDRLNNVTPDTNDATMYYTWYSSDTNDPNDAQEEQWESYLGPDTHDWTTEPVRLFVEPWAKVVCDIPVDQPSLAQLLVRKETPKKKYLDSSGFDKVSFDNTGRIKFNKRLSNLGPIRLSKTKGYKKAVDFVKNKGGGKPIDAKLNSIRHQLVEVFDASDFSKLKKKYTKKTFFEYTHKFKGIDIAGGVLGDSILVTVADNEVVGLNRHWRDITGSWGTPQKVISAFDALYVAIEHIPDVIDFPRDEGYWITKVKLFYYGLPSKQEEQYLTPCWSFQVDGSMWVYVDAFTGEFLD